MIYNYSEFLPKNIFDSICDTKVKNPKLIYSEAMVREKRKCITKDGNLLLLATDHTARMITSYDGNSIRRGNRHELLSSIVRVLLSDGIDGIEGTADILEDLLILNYFAKKNNNLDFLSNKLMIGTVNRGGLKGTSWEMDDKCTCFTVDRIDELRFDGVKFMFRIDITDERSGKTIKYCSDTVNESIKKELPIFIESLFVNKNSNGYSVDLTTLNLIKTVGVASALGNSSSMKWLELPFKDNHKKVSNSTTCPILALPDEIAREAVDVVKEYKNIGSIASNIKGILLGTNVLLPLDEDPLCLAEAIGKIWHENQDPDNALSKAREELVNNEKLLKNIFN